MERGGDEKEGKDKEQGRGRWRSAYREVGRVTAGRQGEANRERQSLGGERASE